MYFVNNFNMSKFKFVNILDLVFISVGILLIFFAWINFFIRNIFLALLCSALLSGLTVAIITYFKIKKTNKAILQFTHQQALEKFKFAIQSASSQKLISILKQLIPKNCPIKIKQGNIFFTSDEKENVFIPFYSQDLNDNLLLNLIKNINVSNITIFCSNYSKEAKYISSIFNNKTITLISLDELYKLTIQKKIKVDTENINLSKPKISVKDILKNSIKKDKSKGYFISGLVLLFTSLIIPYKIYYVIFSSILILLSIICKFKPANNV